MIFVAIIYLLAPQAQPGTLSPKEHDLAQKSRGAGTRYLAGRAKEKDIPAALVLRALLKDLRFNDRDLVANLVSRITRNPPESTEEAAWMAEALEEADRREHQGIIYVIAQYLVDMQLPDGSWGPGQKIDLPDPPPAPKAPPERKYKGILKFDTEHRDPKPKVLRLIKVEQRRPATGTGDLESSQYAALGLLACERAGIRFPGKTIADALSYWRNGQNADGGWGPDGKSTIRFTAAAVGSIPIYIWMKQQEWKKDPAVLRGLSWLGENFRLDASSRNASLTLYSIERAGNLYDTETFGNHRWYAETIRFLLRAQQPDGSWEFEKGNTLRDTCHALRIYRSCLPLVDPRRNR